MIDQYKLKLIFQNIEKIQAEINKMRTSGRDPRVSLSMIDSIEKAISDLKDGLENGQIPAKPREAPLRGFVLHIWPHDLPFTNLLATIDFLYEKL